jgi:hypothetical protein
LKPEVGWAKKSLQVGRVVKVPLYDFFLSRRCPVKRLIPLLLIAVCCTQVHADTEALPYPYVSVSADGRYYFKMLPDPKDMCDENKSKGTMFEVSATGPDKALWSVSGWYARKTYVSCDGKYLVRMGNWPRGAPSKNHIAVAFYMNGELVKSHSTVDLLKDPSRVPRSMSHYKWLREVFGFNGCSHIFALETVEYIRYTFDCRQGTVISSKSLLGSSSPPLGAPKN